MTAIRKALGLTEPKDRRSTSFPVVVLVRSSSQEQNSGRSNMMLQNYTKGKKHGVIVVQA
jgi:hypothetical protein